MNSNLTVSFSQFLFYDSLPCQSKASRAVESKRDGDGRIRRHRVLRSDRGRVQGTTHGAETTDAPRSVESAPGRDPRRRVARRVRLEELQRRHSGQRSGLVRLVLGLLRHGQHRGHVRCPTRRAGLSVRAGAGWLRRPWQRLQRRFARKRLQGHSRSWRSGTGNRLPLQRAREQVPFRQKHHPSPGNSMQVDPGNTIGSNPISLPNSMFKCFHFY